MPVALAPPPTVHIHDFDGPLDLLLHLVRHGRMDIFDLPITELCDQYLVHLNAMENLDLGVAGEFLVMAATLLEIKSRLLLPAPPKDELEDEAGVGEDPRAELVRRLLEYSQYQAIAETLLQREGEIHRSFFREPLPYSNEYALPPKFGELPADALLRALERILADVGAGERSITSVRRQKITLRMTMRLVLGQVERAGAEGLDLVELLPVPPFEVLEIILLFLALLELLKQNAIDVQQDEFCGPIRLIFVPDSERDAPHSAMVDPDSDEETDEDA
ncbi:segregation and condensation protein A [Armatimonas rosea]|uniref:Segregation and condensation protein A n=1 Tax=Armatimonas rosea TaxID=685828 RepID=A0A7W9SRV2_ARMRO|nr:segregation/condensation protein A [Armatimonas rosea]MBB6051680.1 segregation and condensation protein A [Armatimonas rosea]